VVDEGREVEPGGVARDHARHRPEGQAVDDGAAPVRQAGQRRVGGGERPLVREREAVGQGTWRTAQPSPSRPAKARRS
jgi:hypothetical protein